MAEPRQLHAREEHWLNFAIALLLLAAASAKVASAADANALAPHLGSATILQIGFEASLAIWLLVPRFVAARWLMVGATFALFFSVSFYNFVMGKTSCGCLGEFEVPPLAMALIDAAVLIALTVVGWQSSRTALHRRLSVVPLSAAVLVGVAVGGYLFSQDRRAREDARILEIKDWPGKPFPISSDILGPARSELRKGSWVVLLYHSGCARCSSEMQRFKDLAVDKAVLGSTRLAAIEIPPYGSGNEVPQNDGSLNVLRLRNDRAWFVATPQVIYLRDGRVLRVADHLDSRR